MREIGSHKRVEMFGVLRKNACLPGFQDFNMSLLRTIALRQIGQIGYSDNKKISRGAGKSTQSLDSGEFSLQNGLLLV